jgi:hypothetical protein
MIGDQKIISFMTCIVCIIKTTTTNVDKMWALFCGWMRRENKENNVSMKMFIVKRMIPLMYCDIKFQTISHCIGSKIYQYHLSDSRRPFTEDNIQNSSVLCTTIFTIIIILICLRAGHFLFGISLRHTIIIS